MAIENYMPDFAVEAVYDLTVQSLKNQGIKAVLVDLDNTLIAWNNPDGTPEMKQWYMTFVMQVFVSSWCPITLKKGFNVQLKNLGLTMFIGL